MVTLLFARFRALADRLTPVSSTRRSVFLLLTGVLICALLASTFFVLVYTFSPAMEG
jgi:hypothetical protein